MKTVDATLKARMTGEGSTLARLVTLLLLNGTVVFMTDSDRDIMYAGNTYKASYGVSVSQVQLVLGTSAQSATISILLSDDGITTSMIEAGALDDATMSVYVIDFEMPTLPAVLFYLGFVSKVSYKDRLTAVIEGQPLIARGAPLAVDKYNSNCRTDFGDSLCKYPIDSHKATGVAVTAVANAQQFTCNNDAGSWANGLAVFTTGVNAGYSYEIAAADTSGNITLKGIMPFTPDDGDVFTLYPGCDKTPAQCRAYDNFINFQGEPFSISPYTATSVAVTVDQGTYTASTATSTAPTVGGGPPYIVVGGA